MRRERRPRSRGLLCALTFSASCSAAAPTQQQSPSPGSAAPRVSLVPVAGRGTGHWAAYRIESDGRRVDAYVAHDDQPKPIVIVVHGSGCAPLMTVDTDGAFRDTTLFQDLIAPRLNQFHFALVDKRGVTPLRFAPGMTQDQKVEAYERAERECSPAYLANATKRTRVDDVSLTLRALSLQPWARQVLLAGHSEGTHVVTGVVKAMKEPPNAAAVALFASAGPTPFFGGYAAGGTADRQRFDRILQEMRMLQRAPDDMMHKGLPARRWKTFWLDSTPLDDVRESAVPLFVAQGGADGTTLAADLFVLEAIRQQPNRPLRYIVVEDGDHAFATPRGNRIGAAFDDFLRWALTGGRQSGVAVLR